MKGFRRNLGAGLVLLVALGTPACAGRSRVSDAPTGTIAVLATHSKWQDGSYLESGGLDYPTDIYVVDVVRRRVRNLTRDERSEFCWSWVRRGRGIVFASVPNDRMKPGPATIDVVTANGRRRRRLVSSEGVLCPTLSPDGRRISFVVERGRQRGLYVTRIDGTHKKRLTRSLESPRATWSPDGKQILFLREFRRVRGSDIYVINADGTGLRRLTRTKRDREQPAWSPDGQNIAFIRSVGLWSLLFTMRRDGTNVKRLMRTTASASSPTWISNGRVAWQVNRNRERWWAADASGATAPRPLPLPTRVGPSRLYLLSTSVRTRLLAPARAFNYGVVSPDGAWVAYETRGPRLSVAHEDGSHRRVVAPRWDCCLRLDIGDWAPK